MVFSSAIFLFAFLPITFILNLFIRKEYSNVLLLLASLIFYAWGEPILILVMLFSIVFNWLMGWIIEKSAKKAKRVVLVITIISNLGVLGYYKYLGFVISVICSFFHIEDVSMPEISLPIGISFFTFQAISYIVDVYRGETEASSKIINTALYISFFPQLIAGPIVKYREINQQIERRVISSDKISYGFKRFVYGLAKKVLISNVLGICVDTIYSYDVAMIDGKTAWIGAIAYSFQIYYDFSGYSDMAIGLGKMFGFDIPENFNYPYLSKSISEFWRRWHISLGAWFREYVYIPLGGSKKGRIRTYTNLGIVFILTGLWHGADISFIVWGLYHGFFQIVERTGFKKILEKSGFVSTIYCLVVVNFGWVLFRADNVFIGVRFIARMLMPWRHLERLIPTWDYLDAKIMFALFCAVLGMGVMKKFVPIKMQEKWKNSVAEALFCVCIFVLSVASIASDTYNPFIYFQF